MVGVPDDKWGQIVVAYVVTTAPVPSADDLDDFCRRHPMLSQFKRPRAYRFVESLPVSATGKKLHYKATDHAAELFRAGGFETPSSLSTSRG